MIDLPNINGGYATGPIPPGASGDEFKTKYTIFAKDKEGLERLQLTLCDFNEPRKIRFFLGGFRVVWKKYVKETLDLKDFFHPLQDFSGYQKQTFVIKPESYFHLDPGYFESTKGQIGFLIAFAEYLPETKEDDYIYWSYNYNTKDNPDMEHYIMQNFLILSGAINNGQIGNAWNSSGIYFTNPGENPVKLKIIIAN